MYNGVNVKSSERQIIVMKRVVVQYVEKGKDDFIEKKVTSLDDLQNECLSPF